MNKNSRRQSSLLSFFQPKSSANKDNNGQSKTKKPPTPDGEENVKSSEPDTKDSPKQTTSALPDNEPKEPRSIAKRRRVQNQQPNSKGNSKKRRRVVLSDSEEEQSSEEVSDHESDAYVPSDNEDEDEGLDDIKGKIRAKFENEKSRAPSTSTPAANKKTKASKLKSDLNATMSDASKSFLASFRADESLDTSCLLDQSTANVEDKTNRFQHLSFEFLSPEKIRDAAKRSMSDPDYDGRTLHIPDTFLKKQTPGHRQWWQLKSDNFDVILMFKVGKFYELYHMDAVVAVKELNLSYMKGDYAHCGFPEIAHDRFCDQLVARGYKVARIEQTETPAQLEERMKKTSGPKSKVVRRELCRITTPGTRPIPAKHVVQATTNADEHVDVTLGGDTQATYLLAVCERECDDESSVYGICFVDTSVGQFQVGQFADDLQRSLIRTFLAHYTPAQVLYEKGRISSHTTGVFSSCLSGAVLKEALMPKSQFLSAADTVQRLSKVEYLGCAADPARPWPTALQQMLDANDSSCRSPAREFEAALSALGAVVWYLKHCLIDVDLISMRNFVHYQEPSFAKTTESAANDWWRRRSMVLDGITLKNLNVVADDRTDERDTVRSSLLFTLDSCSTAFGKRLLRQWLCSPLCDPSAIAQRQQAVSQLCKGEKYREKVLELMRKIPDLERLLQRIHTFGLKYRSESHPDGRAIMFEADKYNKRKMGDLLACLSGFQLCLRLSKLYCNHKDDICSELLEKLLDIDFPDISDDLKHFQDSFDHDKARKEGVVIPGRGTDYDYDSACDVLRDANEELQNFLKEQRRKLSCSSINFYGTGKNRFQLEIPDNVAKSLPSNYDFKSQRKGFKRYSTKRSEELFAQVQAAEEEQSIILKDLMRRVFADFDTRNKKWASIVQSVANVDVLISLSIYSSKEGMCLPEITEPKNESAFIEIVKGVHPSLAEIHLGEYIANDTSLGGQERSVLLVTGPNMGGKSTLMRQVSTLVILAQLGSYVPAVSCRLSPVDRIFTRLGASDRLTAGESTFYVELSETNVMLRDASAHSLVVLDELGRGTATHDGTAIAYAVLRHLADTVQCRTMFSTHYHSLVEDFVSHPAVALKHMACMVENENDQDPTEETITFMYRLIDGACPKSHGFYAAKLAGVPIEVVRRAHEKSQQLEKLRQRMQNLSVISKLKSAKDDQSLVEYVLSL